MKSNLSTFIDENCTANIYKNYNKRHKFVYVGTLVVCRLL